MVTGANSTPPMDGREYELIYKTHIIGPYAHDIFGLLIDYENTEALYSVDNLPVVDFTVRLHTALGFAKMLYSLAEKGVVYDDFSTTDEKYVSPIVAAVKGNLYTCLKEMEDEIKEAEEVASDIPQLELVEYDEYAEYHLPAPPPAYGDKLDNWQYDNYVIIDMLPGSPTVAALPDPLTVDAVAPILSALEEAYQERLRVKDFQDRDMKMNMFISSVFALGVPAKNQVFQDLYDSLKAFGKISTEQVKAHEATKDPYAQKAFIRSKYRRLKESGHIK